MYDCVVSSYCVRVVEDAANRGSWQFDVKLLAEVDLQNIPALSQGSTVQQIAFAANSVSSMYVALASPNGDTTHVCRIEASGDPTAADGSSYRIASTQMVPLNLTMLVPGTSAILLLADDEASFLDWYQRERGGGGGGEGREGVLTYHTLAISP